MYKSSSQHSGPFYKRKPVLIGGAVLLLIIILAILEFTDTTQLFHTAKSDTPSTGGQANKGETTGDSSKGDPNNGDGSSSDGNGDEADDDKGGSTSGTLVAPSGNFVSSHKNVKPSYVLSSVCNTTAGATCQIEFRKDGTTKSLDAQTTDKGGSSFWNSWKPEDIGLTEGDWEVRAVAKLGSDTKTSTDGLKLEIRP